MPSTIGADLGNLPDRYAVEYDELMKAFKILDLKHPDLVKVGSLDEDIPDTHPAITVISEQMFSKMVESAIKLGLLNESVAGLRGKDTSEQMELLKDTIRLQETEIDELKKVVVNPPRSDQFVLKNNAMTWLGKLALAEGISEIK